MSFGEAPQAFMSFSEVPQTPIHVFSEVPEALIFMSSGCLLFVVTVLRFLGLCDHLVLVYD